MVRRAAGDEEPGELFGAFRDPDDRGDVECGVVAGVGGADRAGIAEGARGLPAGIITDGDLRRQMRPDLMTARVDDIMTRSPRTIDRSSLASEAVELLNSAKIMMLVVTEAGKPVGILHLHDLLRAGVA